jgi:hypothetical protein
MDQPQLRTDVYERRRQREDAGGEEQEQEDPPSKRQKGDVLVSNDNESNKEIIVLDDDYVTSIRGLGTEHDPFMFRGWITGNIIPKTEDGNLFEISDEDGSENDCEDGSADDSEDDNARPSPVRQSPTPRRSPSPRQNARIFSEGLGRVARESDELSSGEDSEISVAKSPSRTRPRALSVSSTSPTIRSATHHSESWYAYRVDTPEQEEEEEEATKDDVDEPLHDMPASPLSRSASGLSSTGSQASIISPSHGTQKHHFDDEQDDAADADGTSCYIVIDGGEEDDDAELSRISSQIPIWEEWEQSDRVKNEPQDDIPPSLTESQETAYSDGPETPGCSREILSSSLRSSMDSLSQASRAFQTEELLKRSTAETETHHNENSRRLGDQREKTKFKKRLFYYTYATTMKKKLRQLTNKFIGDCATTKGSDDCWIYTGTYSVGSTNNIRVQVQFFHEGQKHALSQNIGFVSMLLQDRLTIRAKEGIIEHWWHASHLCGNWRCVNVRHIYPEPGPINSTRNGCFHRRIEVCTHDPPCRKDLKLSMDSGEPERTTKGLETRTAVDRASPLRPIPRY